MSLARCLGRAARIIAARPFSALGGFALLTVIAIGGSLVPWLNFPFLLLGLAPTLGSFATFGLALADGSERPRRDLLGGFRRYQRYLSLVWVGYLTLLFLAWPLWLTLWLGGHFAFAASAPAVAAAAAASAALAIIVLAPYLLVFQVAADVAPEVPVQALLDRSRSLSAGRRAELTLEALALVLLAASGILIFGAGLIFTVPLAVCASSARYRALAPRPSPADPSRPAAAGRETGGARPYPMAASHRVVQ